MTQTTAAGVTVSEATAAGARSADVSAADVSSADVSAADVSVTNREDVLAAARRARGAAARLAVATTSIKDAALRAMAAAIREHRIVILAANAADVAAAIVAGTPDALVDRLRLNDSRLDGMAAGLDQLAMLPDPVGTVVRGQTLPNGLSLRQIRVPLGVVAIVYEARPNVTADAAGIALKAGNAVLLRGSGSAYRSNAAIVEVLANAATSAGAPGNSIQLVPGTDRDSVGHLMTARGLVDVIIPRGGAGLIRHVVENSTVPVIETGVGNCHVYVDASADPAMALEILINSKTRRPSVCNAAETLLVHEAIAAEFVPSAMRALADHGVTVHAEPQFAALAGDGSTVPALNEDFDTEYLSLDIAAAVVPDRDAAIAHIAAHGTGHTEAIVTSDLAAANDFAARVDAAAVMVNASTAFTDGGEFGLGAEIGISTQKLHARGPMGLQELTSTKFVVTGSGHTRSVG